MLVAALLWAGWQVNGLLCVTLISLTSVLGVGILPLMSRGFYSYLLSALIGRSSDQVLVFLPFCQYFCHFLHTESALSFFLIISPSSFPYLPFTLFLSLSSIHSRSFTLPFTLFLLLSSFCSLPLALFLSLSSFCSLSFTLFLSLSSFHSLSFTLFLSLSSFLSLTFPVLLSLSSFPSLSSLLPFIYPSFTLFLPFFIYLFLPHIFPLPFTTTFYSEYTGTSFCSS